MEKVTIRWLNSKWEGVEEAVVRSRIKHTGALEVGMVVSVSYKKCRHKAEVVSMGMPVRNRKSIYRRTAQMIRHVPPPSIKDKHVPVDNGEIFLHASIFIEIMVDKHVM